MMLQKMLQNCFGSKDIVIDVHLIESNSQSSEMIIRHSRVQVTVVNVGYNNACSVQDYCSSFQTSHSDSSDEWKVQKLIEFL